MNKQLELIRIEQRPTERPPDPEFEAVLAAIRAETALFVETAIALGLTEERDTKQWANDIWIKTREHLEQQKAIAVVPVVHRTGPASHSKPPRPYRPQPEERKQRTRCSKVIARHRRRLPLGGWWIDAVQADLVIRPWYFGVCSLPTAGPSVAPDYELLERQRKAIAKEVQLREMELTPA